jgi:DNA-binding transcriptional ArsR family regulator
VALRVKCRCGGGLAQDGCWCPDCLKLPETQRCRKFEQVASPQAADPEAPVVSLKEVALPRAGTQQRQIYDAIALRRGLTDDELEYILGKSHQSVSAGRNALMEAGLVYASQERRETRYGNNAIVWKVSATK